MSRRFLIILLLAAVAGTGFSLYKLARIRHYEESQFVQAVAEREKSTEKLSERFATERRLWYSIIITCGIVSILPLKHFASESKKRSAS